MARRGKLFQQDRRMELRLRLAAKRASGPSKGVRPPQPTLELPQVEIVHRLIARVQRL
jgi:hypothetical protein